MRAREPDQTGFAERDGVRIAWERFGTADRAVIFIPTWNFIHSRISKMQVPYLARHFQVVTFDPRGHGLSDRPDHGYTSDDHYLDALAVMDATGLRRPAVVGCSAGANPAVILTARHPDRVERLVLIAPSIRMEPRAAHDDGFWRKRDRYEGWQKWNAHHWLANWPDFVGWFVGEAFPEPHSSKPIEDAIGWALEADPKLLVQQQREGDAVVVAPLLAEIRCPTLVIHGDDDRLTPLRIGRAVADAIPDAGLVVFEGSGHRPDVRDPVKVNLLLHEFLGDRTEDRRVARAPHRRRARALYISSPIGLGHAQRDLAIANELRILHPDLEIVWLAQNPVTRVLEAAGEAVHPASTGLASESAHIDGEMGEHRLDVFGAWRRMDETLLANFMLFHDIVRDDRYDLWIGDESWELDYYLHENPELKTAPYVFMTDFVGWLPMDGAEDSREAHLTADYNAENIEQVERYPYVRDAALFVGQPEDVIPAPFGPRLPRIPDWVGQHFDFPGYVLPFDPAQYADRQRLRRELELDVDRPLIVASVGGTAVGIHLLRRIAAAFELLRRDVPEAQLLLVTGPRIDPALIEPLEGMQVLGYVHDLFKTLACCDLAVVQGGLSTTMELVALGRPMIYLPLRDHFEQNLRVVHRLRRYGAPEPTSYDESTPAALAEQMRERLCGPVRYQPVETSGAARAAALISPLFEERAGRRSD